MARRVAIVTDRPGWHGARLRRAFKARGFDSVYASLRECRLDLGRAGPGIVIPGFGRGLPDGVFVRGVPGGSLEQVVLRLDVLHALRELGVPVYNDARAIERSVDKAMTSFLLRRAGVPTPATWVTETASEVRALLVRETAAGRELVMKPLFGSQGAGLRRLSAGAQLPDPGNYGGVYYLQSYVDSGEGDWHDWRVFVIGGAVKAAMIRRGASWINNVAQGGRCEKALPDFQLERLARDAVRAVGMDYGGVDIVRDQQGCPYVIEVNSMPAWRGLQGVTEINLAQHLVDDFIARRLVRELEAVC